MENVTHRYHQMQKYKFSVRCPDVLLWNPCRSHLSKKNIVSMFHALDAPQCTM
jgi:hypothetical protein